MDRDDSELYCVLEAWFKPAELQDLQVRKATGGLSGAKLWRIMRGGNSFCLRRWPRVHPTTAELKAIHGFMTHVWKNGLQIVPLPQCMLTQQTLLNENGRLWELANWLPGEAIEKPCAEQMTAAMEVLARLHLAAVSYGVPSNAPAPGLQKRLAILQNLRDGSLQQLEQAVQDSPPTTQQEISQVMLADIRQALPSTLNAVEKTGASVLPLQWCLRDVHVGNYLFTANEVTGLVDFGAAGFDSVAGDVARLMGSLADDEQNHWQECLAVYQKLHPLSSEELIAVSAYDSGGLIASATNWLRWLFVEHRQFADSGIIQSRLSHLARRLKSLNQCGGPPIMRLTDVKL